MPQNIDVPSTSIPQLSLLDYLTFYYYFEYASFKNSFGEAAEIAKTAWRLKLKLVNRNVGEPHTPAAVYLIDQWRRIGVEAEHVQLETKLFYDAHASGNFDVVMDFISDFADDPSAQFDKFLSSDKSSQSVSRHKDKVLDDLFDAQARAIEPIVRKRLVAEFETRGLTQAYSAPILWRQRIVVYNKKIRGWELHPSHFTAHDYVSVWLDQ